MLELIERLRALLDRPYDSRDQAMVERGMRDILLAMEERAATLRGIERTYIAEVCEPMLKAFWERA